MTETASPTEDGLALLRTPFPPNQIGKLPKPTKEQTDLVKEDFRKGMRCPACQGWHHKDVVHLDYVGHAAATARLLDADSRWTWEPVAFGPDGLPVFDAKGGLWIRLTVCGVTRLGYGNAAAKTTADVGSREKECIGDAIRNGLMRFGGALELWHKGLLYEGGDDDFTETADEKADTAAIIKRIDEAINEDEAKALFAEQQKALSTNPLSYARVRAALIKKIDVLRSTT